MPSPTVPLDPARPSAHTPRGSSGSMPARTSSIATIRDVPPGKSRSRYDKFTPTTPVPHTTMLTFNRSGFATLLPFVQPDCDR